MTVRFEIDQLLVVTLAYNRQIFTLLTCFVQFGFQTVYLSQVNACIICSDPICIDILDNIDKVFLLNLIADLLSDIAHFDIKGSRKQSYLLIELLHFDVHFLKDLFLGIFIYYEGTYLLPLSLYHLLKRFILTLVRRLN